MLSKRKELIVTSVGKKNRSNSVALVQAPKNKANRPPRKEKKDILSKSPYFQTLVAPWTVSGVKIPDEITTPSFPVEQEMRIVNTVITDSSNMNNYFGVAIIIGSVGTALDYYTLTGSAADIWTWSRGGSISGSSDLQNVTSAVRPVSAGVTCTYTGNDTNDQGRFVAGFYPGGSTPLNYNGTDWVTLPNGPNAMLSGGAQAPYLIDVPINRKFVELRYAPSDPLALVYGNYGQVPRRSAVNPTNSAAYGIFIITGTGLAAGSAGASFATNFYQNLECLPASSKTSLQESQASFSDPLELAHVTNTVATMPEFNIMQSVDDSLTGAAENWVPPALLPPNGGRNTRHGSRGSANSSQSNYLGLAPMAAGMIGGSMAGKGMLDKIPILGGLLKSFANMS